MKKNNKYILKRKSVTHNFVMNALLTGSNILFPLITYPYAARILQPYGMGMVSFANAIITYFTMFAQLGIPTYGIRICAEVRDDKEKLSRTVQEVMIINIITCILSYTLFFICVGLNEQLRKEKTLFLVMGVAILFNTLGVEWLYKGLEQYTYITVRSVIFKLIALICVFAFVHAEDDYVIYGFITVLALVGSYAMNFINLHRIVTIRPVGGYHIRRHLKPVLVFFGMSVATTIYTNMDSVMLGFIRGAEENGCYDAAVKIKNILVSVVTSLGTVLLPRVSYYWGRGEKERFWKLAKKAISYEILAGASLAAFFIIFANQTICLVSGPMFQRAVLPMEIIMPTLLLIGLSNITGIQIMVPMGMEKSVLYSEIAGAAVNLTINSLFIPRFGAAGAAAGTLAAEAVVLLFQLVVLRKYVRELFGGTEIWKILLAGGMAVVAAVMVNMTIHNNNCGSLILGGILFFGIYGAILLLLREATVWELWNKEKAKILSVIRK